MIIKRHYEIRQVDSFKDDYDGWYWNESWCIAEKDISISADLKRAFKRILNQLGYTWEYKTYKIVDMGDIMELQNSKTDKPIMALVPTEF